MRNVVLLLGFGGPTNLSEIRPFIESVLQGVRVPEARLDEVHHHYVLLGGASPYNEHTEKQRKALEAWLSKNGLDLPVVIGYRHSSPSIKETLLDIKIKGYEQVICVVLSSFRSQASFEKYVIRVEEARQAAGAERIPILYTAPFHKDPLFIEAQASRVLEAMAKISAKEKNHTYFLFTAHSIPVKMSEESGYALQFRETAFLVAERLRLKEGEWGLAYQSRSGDPREAWLDPDVKDAIKKIDGEKFHQAMLIPAGFLCDNAEVLYDIDIEARKCAAERGLGFFRASTVMDHPRFIEMLGRLVLVRNLSDQ